MLDVVICLGVTEYLAVVKSSDILVVYNVINHNQFCF